MFYEHYGFKPFSKLKTFLIESSYCIFLFIVINAVLTEICLTKFQQIKFIMVCKFVFLDEKSKMCEPKFIRGVYRNFIKENINPNTPPPEVILVELSGNTTYNHTKCDSIYWRKIAYIQLEHVYKIEYTRYAWYRQTSKAKWMYTKPINGNL